MARQAGHWRKLVARSLGNSLGLAMKPAKQKASVMKYTLETSFGLIQFSAEVSVPDADVNKLAASHRLFHVVNSKVEKALKAKRGDVTYSTETAAKLKAAYAAEGVVLSEIAAYAPAEKEVSRVKATKLYEQAEAAGKLDKLAKNVGFNAKLSKAEAIEEIHAFLSGGLLAKLTA